MRLKGHLEDYHAERISGWAADLDELHEHLMIELVVDDAVVMTAPASNFRPDLKKAGIGDGDHAVSFKVPERYFDSSPYRVGLRIADSGVELAGSPVTLIFGHRPLSDVPSPVHLAPAPLMTLIVPTFNRAETLERSMEAYCGCSRADEIEIVISTTVQLTIHPSA